MYFYKSDDFFSIYFLLLAAPEKKLFDFSTFIHCQFTAIQSSIETYKF